MDAVLKSGRCFIAPWVLLLPCVAIADQTSRVLDGTVWSFWVSMIFVQVFMFLGWGASSWSQLAGWSDGNRELRFKIGQGIFAAALAGNVAYYGVYYLLPDYGIKTTEVGSFIAAAMAAWAGEKFLTPLVLKFLSFIDKILK